MDGPWTKYAQPPQGAAPWEKFGGNPAPQTAYSGAILPFSKDTDGHVYFDSNAGIVGALKRAVTLPGEVYRGEVQMPSANNPGPQTNYTIAPFGLDTGIPFTAPSPGSGLARSAEMATVVMPVNPAVRAGEAAIPGIKNVLKPGKAKPPTAEALLDAGGVGFDKVREMGVDYTSKSIHDLATSAQIALERDGIFAEHAPTTFALLKKLQNPPEDSVAQLSGVVSARRAFGNAAKNYENGTEQLAAKRVMEQLDQFIENPDPASVVAGPAAAAGKLQEESNANYAAGKRSDLLQGVEEKAGRRAAAANSGRNIGNSTRSRVASVLESDKKTAGFTDKELAALEAVSRGTLGRNTARNVGNLFGGGLGLGALIAGGGGAAAGSAYGTVAGILTGLGLPALGIGAKALDNTLTRKALQRSDEAVRSRSPLAEALAARVPATVTDPSLRSALTRALILSEQQQNLNNGITY